MLPPAKLYSFTICGTFTHLLCPILFEDHGLQTAHGLTNFDQFYYSLAGSNTKIQQVNVYHKPNNILSFIKSANFASNCSSGTAVFEWSSNALLDLLLGSGEPRCTEELRRPAWLGARDPAWLGARDMGRAGGTAHWGGPIHRGAPAKLSQTRILKVFFRMLGGEEFDSSD